MHDVSDSALLNQKLFHSELKLRQFFAAIPDLVVVISLSGSIEFVPTQINLSDPRNQLIIEATTHQFFHDSSDGVWLRLAESVIASQEVKSHEYSLVLADNTTDWFMASIAPLSTDEVVCIIRNITELKHHQIALAQAKEAAENANRSKTIFLQNISHELRTPLNAMIGFTQLLQGRQEISTTASKYLIYILNNSYYLLAMVNQLLDLAKIESDVLHTTLNLCHTRSFIQEIMDQFLKESEQKSLDLILDIETKVPQWIYIDALKVRQILQNLVHNAVKFTHQGSVKLEINHQEEVSETQAQRILNSEIYATTDDVTNNKISKEIVELPLEYNAWLCITVTDTGVGILPEEKSIIWQPFSQGKAGKDSYQGVGLGLAIFQRLIRYLGALIFFDSEIGVGTKFTILLPIKTPHSSFPLDQEPTQLFNPYLNLVNTNSLDEKTGIASSQCDCLGQAIGTVGDTPINSTVDHISNTLNNFPIDDLLSNLNSKDLYMMQRLALEADFNGLRNLCHRLESTSPRTIAVITKMVEEFSYENLLSLIDNFIQKSGSSQLNG
ncbi:MAG: sensor histidine kinase [Pseudanabaenaceae cyanobacterium]